jgi:hypothetical protein
LKRGKPETPEESNAERPLRLPITIYRRQLREIDEICRRGRITRRLAFFNAFQLFIAENKKGGNDGHETGL